jgi:hypothetical protein
MRLLEKHSIKPRFILFHAFYRRLMYVRAELDYPQDHIMIWAHKDGHFPVWMRPAVFLAQHPQLRPKYEQLKDAAELVERNIQQKNNADI